MSRPPMPFYRSPVTRWALFTTGFGLAMAFAPWGPTAWRNTPSLHWLHQLLPWPLISLLFAVYALLLLWGRTEAVAAADWLGLFIYGCELIALIATIRFDRPTNPFAISGVFLACILHFAAARLATFQVFKERIG
jgi:hypothetical protein